MLARLHRVTIFISLSQSVTQGNTMQHHAQTVIQPTQWDIETKVTKGSRGKKSFKCKDCNESFIQSSQCKSHERIHTNGKPHKCQYCDKRFIKPFKLRIHERTHTGEKPYECKYCEKCFTTSANCKSHERVHTGVKPYQCNASALRFFQIPRRMNEFTQG